jgi:Ser/Thr protein kinase RdoA (MazF antagonist)
VVDQAAGGLDRDDRAAINSLLGTWSLRFAALGDCGIPDTLVHGDLHPGNCRGDGDRLVILDWGDSGVGHPLLDQSAFLDGVALNDASAVRAHWARGWRSSIPGCDPDRAAALLEPISAIRHAAVYQNFLDRIEPDERIYHVSDPLDWLRRTAALVRRR